MMIVWVELLVPTVIVGLLLLALADVTGIVMRVRNLAESATTIRSRPS